MPKKKKSRKRRKAGKKKRAVSMERFLSGNLESNVRGRKLVRYATKEGSKEKADEDDDEPKSGKYAGPRAL